MNLQKLIEELNALTPAQLRAAAACVKRLQGGSADEPEERAQTRDLYVTVRAADLRIEECEQGFADVVGVNPAGKALIDLIDEEYRDSARHAFELVRGHRETKNVRLRLLRSKGSSVPVTMAARWVDAGEGAAGLIDVVFRDISALKRIGNIEIFSEMLSIGVALVDEQGRIAFANSSAEKLFGYEQGELEHQRWEGLFPGQALSDAAHRANEQETVGRRKDGSSVALKIGWSSIRLSEQRFAVASIADITARKSIEDELRRHEEERALIFSEGLLGDFTWHIERDEVEAHPTVFKLYGAAPIAGVVPGDWFRRRQHPDDRAATDEKWRSQMEAGGELAVEFRVNGDDGATRWIDCRGVVVRDERGVPRQVHGLNIDITARKQAEARAVRAEELLRTALQYSNTAVWRWNIDEDKTEWSGPVEEVYGFDAAAISSWAAFQKVVLASDRQRLSDELSKCIAEGSEFHHEFRIVRADGNIRWVTGRAGMLREANGRVYGMAGVNFDITKRKMAEEDLRQSDRDFRELTNVIPQIVFTANAAGDIVYHNERYYEIRGIAADAAAHSRWPEILNPEDRERILEAWRDSIASGRPFEQECRMWDQRAGQSRWYLVRAVPVRNAENAIVRWIGTSTDIHDQKTAEERLESEVRNRTQDLHGSLNLLREREEQLEKSLLEKDALLREIHHRVKNNLQIVSSLLSMQAENEGNGSAMAPLRDSQRRISSMAMIHEQLYGTDDLQTVEFAEHARMLSQSLLVSMADSSRISCQLDLQPVSLTIHQAIPCALILNELLTNAFKYAYPGESGSGEITVRLAAEPGMVTMTVSDKGVGLPPSIDAYKPKTLGLEIVQVLVSQLEGELSVVGAPGVSFTVKFRPQASVSHSHSTVAAASGE